MATAPTSIRLFILALALPIVIMASDELLISNPAKALNNWFFIWLVLQTALISHVAGKWLDRWLWRVVVLTWTLLLLNLLLFHALALATEPGRYESSIALVPYAFLASQLSLLAAWTVLGAMPWQWRLPSVAVAALPAIGVFAELHRRGIHPGGGWNSAAWNEIAGLQVTATAVLAMLLRWRGHRVTAASSTVAGDESPVNQFTLTHMLIWTAAIAPLLLLAKAIDYASPSWFGWRQWGLVVAYGALLAPSVLAALWVSLGAGRLRLKLVGLALIATATGGALRLVEDTFGTTPGLRAGVYGTHVMVGNRWFTKFTNAGWGWIAWTVLAGFLLAGMLLVFRVTGYRLIRQRNKEGSTPRL